jgi:SPP1 gp7 family putative phage head morphogenesis protein
VADNLKAILEHINGEVGKLSVTSTHALGPVLDAAEKELTKDLAKWHALAKGDEKFTPQMYRNALIQIRSALNTIRGDLGDDISDHMKAQGHKAAGLATKHLHQEVEQFSHMFEGSVRHIALEAAEVLAVGQKAVWKRFDTSAARYAGQVGKDIQKQLAIGVVRGETIDQLTTRLAKMGGPKGWVNVTGMGVNAKAEYIAEGLFHKYRYYAERLVRTEVVSAYNSFALDGMEELNKEDPGYMKRWDAAIDGRTCVLCASYDDLVRKLDEPFKDGIEQPPAHSNCRCAQVIWRKEWTEAEHRHDAGRTDRGVRGALDGKAGGETPAPKGTGMPHKITYD